MVERTLWLSPESPYSIQPIGSGPKSAAASAGAGGLLPARQRRDRPADRSGTASPPPGGAPAGRVPPTTAGGTVDVFAGRRSIMEQAQYTDGGAFAGAPSSPRPCPATHALFSEPSPCMLRCVCVLDILLAVTSTMVDETAHGSQAWLGFGTRHA